MSTQNNKSEKKKKPKYPEPRKKISSLKEINFHQNYGIIPQKFDHCRLTSDKKKWKNVEQCLTDSSLTFSRYFDIDRDAIFNAIANNDPLSIFELIIDDSLINSLFSCAKYRSKQPKVMKNKYLVYLFFSLKFFNFGKSIDPINKSLKRSLITNFIQHMIDKFPDLKNERRKKLGLSLLLEVMFSNVRFKFKDEDKISQNFQKFIKKISGVLCCDEKAYEVNRNTPNSYCSKKNDKIPSIWYMQATIKTERKMDYLIDFKKLLISKFENDPKLSKHNLVARWIEIIDRYKTDNLNSVIIFDCFYSSYETLTRLHLSGITFLAAITKDVANSFSEDFINDKSSASSPLVYYYEDKSFTLNKVILNRKSRYSFSNLYTIVKASRSYKKIHYTSVTDDYKNNFNGSDKFNYSTYQMRKKNLNSKRPLKDDMLIELDCLTNYICEVIVRNIYVINSNFYRNESKNKSTSEFSILLAEMLFNKYFPYTKK